MRLLYIFLALLAVFAVIRLAFPFRRESLPPGFPSFDELRSKYWKLDLVLLFAFYLGTGALAAGFGYALHQLATRRYAGLAADALFFIEPALSYWITIGALLALPVAAYIVNRIVARRLGAGYTEYRLYNNLKYRFDRARVLPWVHRGFIAAGLVLTVLFMNWYTAFYNDRIVYCPLGSFTSKAHSYADVQQLSQRDYYGAPSDAGAANDGFVIRFSDGSSWSSAESGYPDWEGNAEVLDFVAAHTGVPVEGE